MFGGNLLKRMDKAAFLGFDVWDFCARSLLRSYGQLFLRAAMLRHPVQTVLGAWSYRRYVRPLRQTDSAPVGVASELTFHTELAEGNWLVGIGFCQKPLEPPCPARRFNHRCWLLEQLDVARIPAACLACPIREVANHALPAGATLYIMTSAIDIARDMLLPAFGSPEFHRLLLVVCPYSAPPLALAMSICGLRGLVFAFSRGDCHDYAAWLGADKGMKQEQTFLSVSTQERLLALLDAVAKARAARGGPPSSCFKELGNFYIPVA